MLALEPIVELSCKSPTGIIMVEVAVKFLLPECNLALHYSALDGSTKPSIKTPWYR